jgi:hypothetical protein
LIRRRSGQTAITGVPAAVNKEGRIAPALFVFLGYAYSSASDWFDSTLNVAPVQKKLSTIRAKGRWPHAAGPHKRLFALHGWFASSRVAPLGGQDLVSRTSTIAGLKRRRLGMNKIPT